MTAAIPAQQPTEQNGISMPQPVFRQRITAWMQQRPAPLPRLWHGVDRIHFTTDAVIGLIEKAHIGVRDQIVLRAAARVGVPPSAIEHLPPTAHAVLRARVPRTAHHPLVCLRQRTPVRPESYGGPLSELLWLRPLR